MTTSSPYRGLAPFEDSELDALFFFGREHDSEVVVANLIASRFTVLYGPSGVGKSSLLLASVARALRELPEQPLVVVFSSWTEDPERGLAQAVGEGDGKLLEVVERAQAERDVYLILDQAEEYFVYHGEDTAFEEALAGLVTRPLRVNVLLSLREDTLARLDRLKALIPNLFGNVLRLDRLDRASGRAAIVRPLERWGELHAESVTADDALVEDVLDGVGAGRIDLGPPGGQPAVGLNGDSRIEAPYLQLVMQRLWDVERASGSSTLRAATLADLGGAGQVVADHLERAIDALTQEQQALAAVLFDHLVTPSGTKIAHEASDLAQFTGKPETEVRPVLASLVDSRIIRTDEGGRYEIFHDVLAAAVVGWTVRHRSEQALATERRRRRRAIGIAAIAVATTIVLAAIAVFAIAQRERAQNRARDAQARRLDASSTAILPTDPELGLLLASESARLSPGPTSEEAVRAALLASTLRGVLNLGEPVREVDFAPNVVGAVGTGGRLRLWNARSHKVLFERDVGANGGLSITRRRSVVLHGSSGPPVEVAFDGSTVCTYGAKPVVDATVAGGVVVLSNGQVFELGTCSARTEIEHVPKSVSRVVSSPDGERVAFIVRGRATVVALPSRRVVSRFRHRTKMVSLTFDRDGKRAVTAASNSEVARVWDVDTGRLERELRGHYGDVVVGTIDPSGSTIVTGSNDGQGRVWDATTGNVLTVLPGHLNFVEAVDITPDAVFVATGSPDRTARTWTQSGRLVVIHAGHTDAVTSTRFTSNGLMLVTGSDDGTVRLWDAGTAPDLVPARATPPAPPSLEAFTADRSAEARADGAVIRITRRDGSSSELVGHANTITSVSFSPDGRRLVSASRDNDAILWDARTGTKLSVLRAHFGPVFDARFSPDGRWIVTAGPLSAGLWNASNGSFVRYLRGAPGPLAVVGFQGDSRTIVTVSRDGTVSRYRCEVCGTIPELLELVGTRLRATGRTLTQEERELYFG
jgi:WD40 repeat protein